MSRNKIYRGAEKERLFQELEKRFCDGGASPIHLKFLRKKYAWLFIVEGSKLLKKVIDVMGAFILLILTGPLFLLISILIKLSDGGSIFYVSTRVGKWGEEFQFPKFRTMCIGAEQEKVTLSHYNETKGEKTFKLRYDPRITLLGRFLRKSSLDELPQLWCVLKGEMSLVGPRPPLPEEVSKYNLHERRRLDVLPGLTCFWQVSGRSEIPFDKQMKLDLQYIESQSFWVDLKILLRTIPAVLLGRGAY